MSAGQSEPRWLSEREQVDWRAYLDAVALINEALNRQLEQDSDLSLAEYDVMVRLSESPERSIRMSELADLLVHSRSRLTHTIKRMESRGLVERVAVPEDRRGVRCVLTDTGYAALVDAAPGHVEAVRRAFLDHLTPTQFHNLGIALAAVRDGLRCPED